MTSVNVEKLRARDEQALGELFNELMPTLRRVARRFHAGIDPDEVVAEVVVQLLRDTDRLADLAASGKLLSYCVRLTTNVAIHHVRRTRRAQTAAVGFDELSAEPRAGETYSNVDLRGLEKKLEAAISRLGSHERSLIEMLYFQGQSLDVVAQHFGVSPTAVRVKLHRARQNLRRLMSAELESAK